MRRRDLPLFHSPYHQIAISYHADQLIAIHERQRSDIELLHPLRRLASEWSTWTRIGSRDMISLTLRVIAPPDYAPGTSDGSGGAALIVLPARLRNPVQSPGCFRQRALGRQIAERHNANEALIAI